MKRLLPVLEELLIDSEPIPTCRFKRAGRCKYPGAAFGFTTQGMIFGFKLHVWTALNGRVMRYKIRPANEHDLTVGTTLNDNWPAFGGPKIIGDKAYQDGANLTPPKSNARQPDPRWKEEYEVASKAIECAFSSVAGRGLRWGQVKTFDALRLKVALILVAYNLRFARFGPVNP